MNYKFQSKFRNCAFVIKRALPGDERLGLQSVDWYHLRFENGICNLPELKAEELVKNGNKEYTILELIRMHPRFNKDFFEVEEVSKTITKTMLPKDTNRTININNGHIADPMNPLDILNNPMAKEMIMSLAQELAKSLASKKEDTSTKEATDISEVKTGEVIVWDETKEPVLPQLPTEVIQGVDTEFVNWTNFTVAGREEPYKNLTGLMAGLKAKGISVITKE